MTRAYSRDLQDRVIDAVIVEGMSRHGVAHPVAAFLEGCDDFRPTKRAVPFFGMGGSLHGDAHIRLGNRPAVIRHGDPGRHLCRVDPENIPSCGAGQHGGNRSAAA
jgi:hypothetical protein